jgi:hypothetical protein
MKLGTLSMDIEILKHALEGNTKEEDKHSKTIVDLINKSWTNDKIKVCDHLNILTNITCGISAGRFRLLFQSAEQDIVFYYEMDDQSKFEGRDFFKAYQHFPDDKIYIPLLIFEVKFKGVISHQIKCYNSIATMIKGIFPFCMYNLLLLNFPNPSKDKIDKIYMSAKNFDKILYSQKADNNMVGDIISTAETHIKKLKNEPFYRMGTLV